jgi:hypothetical protein
VMNHEGKANRRFQPAAQVRIRAPNRRPGLDGSFQSGHSCHVTTASITEAKSNLSNLIKKVRHGCDEP